MDRLRTLPAPWAGAARATVKALAKAERAAIVGLRRAVRGQVDIALARLAVMPVNGPRDAAAAIVQQTGQRLASSLASRVEIVRREGRRAGTGRLIEEWRLVCRAIEQALGPQTLSDMVVSPDLDAEDRARAAAAGQAYVATWTIAALAAVSLNDATRSVGQRLSEATTALDYRVVRIGTTESAQAFNDARDEGMGWVAERYGDERWFPAVLKRWDATLDAKVCPVCRDMNGSLALWGMPFKDGMRPGYVHPSDRCTPGIVFLPARIRGERIPGRQVDDERPREAA